MHALMPLAIFSGMELYNKAILCLLSPLYVPIMVFQDINDYYNVKSTQLWYDVPRLGSSFL